MHKAVGELLMENLVQVRNLKKYFPLGYGLLSRRSRFVKAVDGVNLDIVRGETLALVGESGSGKTTLGRLILRLIEPSSGTVIFDGQDIFRLRISEMRLIRPKMQMIFQDPLASLNPRKTVRQILEQPFKLHTSYSNEQIYNNVIHLLELVQLTPPEMFLERFPHELSGGQRQRVCIARAIALKPLFVVADEPVSALDISIRGQIINLLKELQAEMRMTYLFITHDLATARSISDRIAVMYLGKIIETGETPEVFKSPLHPYTRALLSAIPLLNPEVAKRHKRIILGGEVPSPINPPSGCSFHPRCPLAMEKCKKEEPKLIEPNGRLVACHLA